MRLGAFGKLLLAMMLVVGAATTAGGVLLHARLRDQLLALRRQALLAHARTAAVTVSDASSARTETLDALADALGAATATRITVIGLDGWVLGDSELSLEQLATVENHARRPEIREALAHGSGVAQRHSATVHTDMLYAAVPFPSRGAPHGVVRAAVSLGDLDRTLGQLRLAILLSGLVVLAVGAAAAAATSHGATRVLRGLLGQVEAVVRRELREQQRSERQHDGEAEVRAPGPRRAATSIAWLAGELDRAQQAVGRRLERYESILEHLNEAVVAVDRRERLSAANAAARSLFGLEAEQIGWSLRDMDEHHPLRRLLDRAGEQGQVEVEIEGGDRTPRRVEVKVAALTPPLGRVVLIRDVTRERHLEQVRRDFVANVSHELRTPLSVLHTGAETLLSGALDDPRAARRFAESMARNAERLSAIVDDLLELSRIEAGATELQIEPTRLSDIARGAADTLADRATARDVHLRVELSDSQLVMADGAALERVLVNLLDNAIKHAPGGGEVLVRAELEGADVRIDVDDDGPGVPPEHRQRVFERFYRVDAGRSRAQGGTGLGLAIVKHLVELMGGRVGVTTARGGGASFWVRLSAPNSSAQP